MSKLITKLEDITAGWLTASLKNNAALERGHVTGFDLRPHATLLSTACQLEITYSDDAAGVKPPRLFFKLSRPSEAVFYRYIAPQMPTFGLLRCYDAAYSKETGRAHLLLDDLSATHYAPEEDYDSLPVDCAGQMIDVMAAVHAHWWEHPRLHDDIGQLNEHFPDYVRKIAQEDFPRFVDALGSRLTSQQRTLYERILSNLPLPAWRQRAAQAQKATLVHGDTHWWNFLYPHNSEAHQLCLLDWAVWHINVGVSDVSYFVIVSSASDFRAQHEQTLLQRYHERLLAGGVRDYDWAQCWQDYRMSILDHMMWPIFWQPYLPESIWWVALKNLLPAFEALECEEFLT